MIDLYHWVRVLECEVIKANQQVKFSHHWLIQSANEMAQANLRKPRHGDQKDHNHDTLTMDKLVNQLMTIQSRLVPMEGNITSMRFKLKHEIQRKSSVISQGNDFDVEIDYVIDQIRKASADLVMDMKAHTMKL